MDKFVLPSIPRIHVPTSSSSDHKSKEDKKKKESTPQKDKNDDGSVKKILETPPPKLCPSCSKVLLEYLIPLQQYINHVVEMTIEECGLKHVATQITSQTSGLRIPTTASPSSSTSTASNEVAIKESNNRDVVGSTRKTETDSSVSSHTRVHTDHSASHVGRESQQKLTEKSKSGKPSERSGGTEAKRGNQEQSRIQGSEVGYKFEKGIREERVNTRSGQAGSQPPERQRSGSYSSTQTYQANKNISDTRHSGGNGIVHGHDSHHREHHHTERRLSAAGGHFDRRQSSDHGKRSQSAERPRSNFYPQPNEERRERSFTIPGPPVIQAVMNQQMHEKFGSNEGISSSGYEDPSCEDHASSKFEPSHHQVSEELFGHNNSQEDLTESVNAYVTIIYNNLSAINAIILANSLIITRKSSDQIPFIVLIGGKIDPTLRRAVDSVFDQVINIVQDFRLSLISNMTLGQQPLKFQLWKVLSPFEKCLFIESACTVVSDISHVFDQFNELSACVDWIFPDFFSCSVFVMEPNEGTYNNLVQFAAEANEDSYRDFDEGIDEMVVLNQFFAPKWNKVSFVYNFVPNSAVYTQTPAFLKFGGDVKIVNFGYSTVNASGSQGSSQPWHVMFDLSVNDHVSTSSPTDNFTMFYLDIFLKRLWPLLQQTLTPLLLTRIGKREWSVYELTRFLSIGSETDELMYNPISMRRKPPAMPVPQIINTEVVEESDETAPQLQSIPAADGASKDRVDENGDNVKQSEVVEITDEVKILEESEGATAAVVEESIESKMRPWDTGSIDWMGVHKSDKIIERLMGMMKD